ncbi:alpha/beta fold hydrolase [Nocardia sp. XZ_19_385]|uniref:alpha/beta fold hydrolase n=1 Tax=Nocardia sp. XZ_19_385 TaxID=2769488 RepID=UPI00188EAA68|nr:alpha/beta hydrolase [Nocardia sp. XZ_19_385]
MSTISSPILFLSGAGLPAWIWDEVRAGLGAESVVANYPEASDASLRDYAEAVLQQAPGSTFTLVAHSIGGVVASEIAAIAPERVHGLLGVAASIPAAGTSFLGALPFPQRHIVSLAMRVAGTRPPEKALRTLATGLGDAETARIVSDFDPESQSLYRDRVAPRRFPARTGYVVASADPEFPAALQRKYATELGAEFRRELPTGHLPMVQDPAALAQIIKEFTQ